MIKISGVSDKQIKLLDQIWQFDTEDELFVWIKTLNKNKQKKVLLLKEMIELAAIDEYVSMMEDFPHADFIVDSIIGR